MLKYLEKIHGKLKKNICSKLLMRYNKKVFMKAFRVRRVYE